MPKFERFLLHDRTEAEEPSEEEVIAAFKGLGKGIQGGL